MNLYGLIGYPLGHSFSKRYFSEKFAREGIADAQYELFPMADVVADLPNLLREQAPALRGLNVTIPHKEAVLPLLHELDETARAVGAVNCIRVGRNGRLRGFNTDVIGFEQSLRRCGDGRWAQPGVEAVVLGTGGAAKAVAFVLHRLGLNFRYVSRTAAAGVLTYEDWAKELASRSETPLLVVNTTPLGMAPHTNTCPDVSFECLKAGDLVFDLVYNPLETVLLQRAKACGCTTQNGLEMLHLQAEAAWKIWQDDHDG
jgi:shikimate dehydrogenase